VTSHTLGPEGARCACHLLGLTLRDLYHEIHHTDSREFKAGLRHEEKLIRGLLERPGSEAAAAAR
jgi:hypothetical protein